MTQYITIKDLGDVLYVVTVHQSGKIQMSTFEKKNIDINIDAEKQEITIVSDKETMTFLYKNVTLPVTTALADLSTLLNSYLEAGTSVSPTLGFELLSNKSSSIATDWDSTDKYPNVKTIKEYVDASVSGLFDYRGGHDVSVGNLPSVGGSGNAGAIQKGDAWVIAGAGTIGTTNYSVGDIIIAKIDNPADDDENDWNLLITGVSYVPEDSANKVTSVNVNSTDDQYPSAKAMYAALQSKVNNANHALSISGQNLTIVGGNTITLPQPTFPYKSYVAILRQVNSLAPTEDCVLVNTIGTMTITRISAGSYEIACPNFVYNKTVVISPTFYFKGIGSGFAYYNGATSVMIYTKNESGNFADLNQILWNTIEVRVYN